MNGIEKNIKDATMAMVYAGYTVLELIESDANSTLYISWNFSQAINTNTTSIPYCTATVVDCNDFIERNLNLTSNFVAFSRNLEVWLANQKPFDLEFSELFKYKLYKPNAKTIYQ